MQRVDWSTTEMAACSVQVAQQQIAVLDVRKIVCHHKPTGNFAMLTINR